LSSAARLIGGLVHREEDPAAHQQGGRVVRLARQRGVGRTRRVAEASALQLVPGEPRVGPCDRLGIARARRRNRPPYQLDRSVEIAFQPAEVGGPRIRLIERLEVDHPLIRLGSLRQTALLHQDVAQQAIVEHELAFDDQPARNLFRFVKPMELVQHMTPQQER
jgi:hypothetical protein